MKQRLTFLLLLITLTCTFYPCCLEDECNDEEIATAQKENKGQSESSCSPFFACSTCPGFTAMSKPIHISSPIVLNQVDHATLVIFNLHNYSASFWQPPRIC